MITESILDAASNPAEDDTASLFAELMETVGHSNQLNEVNTDDGHEVHVDTVGGDKTGQRQEVTQ